MHLGWQWAQFPGCFLARPQRLIEQALKIGYDGVQMLPVRDASIFESNVLLWERAWNAVYSLGQALSHQNGSEGLPSCLHDWVLFPDPDKCKTHYQQLEWAEVPQVVHATRLVPLGSLVEVNPDNRLTAQQYIHEMQANCLGGFVIDTHHLRRESWQGWPNPLVGEDGSWRATLDLLAPYVKAIHIHPTDIDFFLADPTISVEAKIVRRLLGAGTPTDGLIVVAEYLPPMATLLSARVSIGLAADVLKAMKDIMTSD